VSFSRVQYTKIASFYGLAPESLFEDVETFDLVRARLPNLVFVAIVRDMDRMMGQYGPPHHHHTTEEARSRFLTPVLWKEGG